MRGTDMLLYLSMLIKNVSRLTTARSICTTDTFPKLLSMNFALPSCPDVIYSIAGMTKGWSSVVHVALILT